MGISAMGIVDISWQRTTHKLPDPPYWDDKVPDAEYDGLPVQHFSLPFKKNTSKSCTSLTGEKVKVKAKNGTLSVTVFGRKQKTSDTILKIKLGDKPVMEN